MNVGERLVVIGNGMAGAKVVEEILARDREKFRITMFGAEPYGNYNRILLSNVLNGSQDAKEIFMNPLGWYQENDTTLRAGVKAVAIDRPATAATQATITSRRSIRSDRRPKGHWQTKLPSWKAVRSQTTVLGASPSLVPITGVSPNSALLSRPEPTQPATAAGATR